MDDTAPAHLLTAAPRNDSVQSGSLRALFEPRSVAVIGAGRRRGSVGAEVFHNLLAAGFTGAIFPINPHATAIESVPAYARVTAVPGAIDLAVITVPAACVEAAIDDCIAAHVPAIVVIAAGFSELGDEGRRREAAIRDRVRQAGLRMVGPNCLGVLTTNPAIRLNATFSPVFPPAGPIAFSSQSGALGLAVLEYAQRRNLGISSFVSVGNKADVSSNDLIEYWADDPLTSVILLYVESFGNPKRFRQIARRVGRTKPIVAVKAGRSASGARAASSHTGAIAASDVIVDALFRASGVIRTETLEELFDVAALLAHQPVPAGSRVAILTNAGGPGILAADACEALGLTMPRLSPATTDGLRDFLPPTASIANPVDMIATAPADHYRRALSLLLADPGIDSVMTIFIPLVVTDTSEVARTIRDVCQGVSKPVLATFFGVEGATALLAPVPCYTFPEASVRALAHAVAYGRWRHTPEGSVPAFSDMNRAAARQIVTRVANAGGGWLPPELCSTLMSACGLPNVATHIVRDIEGAVAAAAEVGFPVVLKGSGPGILHKTEAHSILTDLADESAVRRAFSTLTRRPDVADVILQPMVQDGVEMIVGGTRDERFGHVVVCGSGGTLVELLHDTACRLTPITEHDATEMLNEIRGIQLLRGFRGAPWRDEGALRTTVLRVSALLEMCPQIVELDFNPVIVTGAGSMIVDARIRVARDP